MSCVFTQRRHMTVVSSHGSLVYWNRQVLKFALVSVNCLNYSSVLRQCFSGIVARM